MKRIHLFEFEDFNWFPHWIRLRMTRLINVMHKLVGTSQEITEPIARVLKETGATEIVDLCSGSGGPMPEVLEMIRKKPGLENTHLTLTDLYPDVESAKKFNNSSDKIKYLTKPVDATQVGAEVPGLRTMVSSFHHMNPTAARKILESAQQSRQPIALFEISDNAFPVFIWWIAFPINIISCFFVTLLVRPMSWQQVVFTYLIPIIPLFFAWDGAVSNARTYTLTDMDLLLKGLETKDYTWEKGTIKGKTKKLYLLGMPAK